MGRVGPGRQERLSQTGTRGRPPGPLRGRRPPRAPSAARRFPNSRTARPTPLRAPATQQVIGPLGGGATRGPSGRAPAAAPVRQALIRALLPRQLSAHRSQGGRREPTARPQHTNHRLLLDPGVRRSTARKLELLHILQHHARGHLGLPGPHAVQPWAGMPSQRLPPDSRRQATARRPRISRCGLPGVRAHAGRGRTVPHKPPRAGAPTGRTGPTMGAAAHGALRQRHSPRGALGQRRRARDPHGSVSRVRQQ